MILNLLGIILINMISNTLGTLKTIFSTKKFLRPLYIVTFVDAIIFATIMKQIATGNGYYFIFAFALGKVLGALLGDFIDGKLALGILEVDVFVTNKQKMKDISDTLRNIGYSVNTYISYGALGLKRYKIEVAILRKEIPVLEKILDKHGYKNPTLKIKDINNVHGKITIRATA